jgi:tRNA(fMet)-specific endonuclease VapC
MTIWILDTDHISLWQRRYPPVLQRLQTIGLQNVTVTVITVEEQFRGRLDQLRRAKSQADRITAYQWLRETTLFLGQLSQIETWSAEAERHHIELKQQRIRIGGQDLRIAAIALAVGGTVVTRNRRDFDRVTGLQIDDWSI